MIKADHSLDFHYQNERFADLQLLRYRLTGFENLSVSQKKLVYYLSKATLYGRDITFDQFGKYNLRIRKMLEAVYTDMTIDHTTDEFRALEVYLKRVWFSNGIHHHYGCEKFIPDFSAEYLREQLLKVAESRLPLRAGETIDAFCVELFPVIFDPQVQPKRVNKADGEDLAFITVSLTDAQGTLIPQADDQLTFEVTGAGSFEAVCNGDATSLESFKKPTMKLFSGQLVVIVRSAKHPGTLTLKVKDQKRKLSQTIDIKVQ